MSSDKEKKSPAEPVESRERKRESSYERFEREWLAKEKEKKKSQKMTYEEKVEQRRREKEQEWK